MTVIRIFWLMTDLGSISQRLRTGSKKLICDSAFKKSCTSEFILLRLILLRIGNFKTIIDSAHQPKSKGSEHPLTNYFSPWIKNKLAQ